jgi:hypothetical protein
MILTLLFILSLPGVFAFAWIVVERRRQFNDSILCAVGLHRYTLKFDHESCYHNHWVCTRCPREWWENCI